MMEEELVDLPQRVRQQFMPARKKLLIDVFIPEVEMKISQFSRAQAFITELLVLSHGRIKEQYLQHALFKRFYSTQFLKGGVISPDPASPMMHAIHNVQPAMRQYLQNVRHSFAENRIPLLEKPAHAYLPFKTVQEILALLENLANLENRASYTYLVLPPTLTLKEAVSLMNRKDEIYDGVPLLVLVFIGKFNVQGIKTDTRLREAYFLALKHNVIINIDGHVVVDNPRAIASRLLQETLGCTQDMPRLAEMAENVPGGSEADRI